MSRNKGAERARFNQGKEVGTRYSVLSKSKDLLKGTKDEWQTRFDQITSNLAGLNPFEQLAYAYATTDQMLAEITPEERNDVQKHYLKIVNGTEELPNAVKDFGTSKRKHKSHSKRNLRGPEFRLPARLLLILLMLLLLPILATACMPTSKEVTPTPTQTAEVRGVQPTPTQVVELTSQFSVDTTPTPTPTESAPQIRETETPEPEPEEEPTPTPEETETPPAAEEKVCPFEPDQMYNGHIQFPIIASTDSDDYTVKILQSDNLVITENTEVTGPFDYINPSNIAVGWVMTDNGPQEIAYLSTYSLNPTPDGNRTYVYGSSIKPFKPHVQDADFQRFMLEQAFYRKFSGDYDNWEATDWNKTDSSINRPRSGFGDEWTVTVTLPDNVHLQRLISEVPNNQDSNSEVGGEYSVQELSDYVIQYKEGAFLWQFGLTAPMIDDLTEANVQGMIDFLKTGDVSGLPTITVDGVEYKFLPTTVNNWEADKSAEDYQK